MEFIRDVDTILKKDYGKKGNEEQLKFLRSCLLNNQMVVEMDKKELLEKKKARELEKQRTIKKVVKPKQETHAMKFAPIDVKNKTDISQYTSSIDSTDDYEKISTFLPDIDNPHFDEIINSLLVHYISITTNYENFITDFELEYPTDDKSDILKDIKKAQDLVDLIKEYREEITTEIPTICDKKATIVFLETAGNNNLFINDLKTNIPLEYYRTVRRMLFSFEDCSLKNTKKFQSSSSLGGTSEMRHIRTGLRIHFDKLGDNTYILLGITLKKTTSGKKTSNFFENRKKTYDGCYSKIINSLGDQEYLNKQNEDYNTMLNKLGFKEVGGELIEGKNLTLHC